MKKELSAETLLELLSRPMPLDREVSMGVRSLLKMEKFEPGRLILKAGNICDRMRYIIKGAVQCYEIAKKGQDTDYIMTEGEITISKNSFFKQVPSVQNIEAIETTVTLSMTYAELDDFYRKHPSFLYNAYILLGHYHCQSDIKLELRRSNIAEERFEMLKILKPEYIERFPKTILAPFLGLSREALSRRKWKTKIA